MYRRILILTAALLSLTSSSHAQWFVRGAVTCVMPNEDGHSAATGAALTAGKYLGKHSEHELSLEVSSARWHYDGFNYEERETRTPVLLNYRYHIAARDDLFKNVEFYLGPSLGYSQSKLHFRIGSGYESIGVDPTDETNAQWVFNWGGSAGCLVRVYRNAEIDFGYRFTHSESGAWNFSHLAPIPFRDINTSTLYLGLGVRF